MSPLLAITNRYWQCEWLLTLLLLQMLSARRRQQYSAVCCCYWPLWRSVLSARPRTTSRSSSAPSFTSSPVIRQYHHQHCIESHREGAAFRILFVALRPRHGRFNYRHGLNKLFTLIRGYWCSRSLASFANLDCTVVVYMPIIYSYVLLTYTVFFDKTVVK